MSYKYRAGTYGDGFEPGMYRNHFRPGPRNRSKWRRKMDGLTRFWLHTHMSFRLERKHK